MVTENVKPCIISMFVNVRFWVKFTFCEPVLCYVVCMCVYLLFSMLMNSCRSPVSKTTTVQAWSLVFILVLKNSHFLFWSSETCWRWPWRELGAFGFLVEPNNRIINTKNYYIHNNVLHFFCVFQGTQRSFHSTCVDDITWKNRSKLIVTHGWISNKIMFTCTARFDIFSKKKRIIKTH